MTTPADPADRYAAYMRSREQDGPALTAFQAKKGIVGEA